MGPIVIIVVVGVLAVAALVALVYAVGRGTGEDRARITWLTGAFAVLSLLAVVTLNLASVFYRIPPAVIAAGVAVMAGLVVLFIVIGRSVAWRPTKVLALVGVMFASFITFAAFAMTGAGGDQWIQPLYRTRVAQMAEEMGFVPVLPADEPLITDYLPITEVSDPSPGIKMEFQKFYMEERPAEGTGEAEELAETLAPGARPMEGCDVPSKFATWWEHTVRGEPALAVTYADTKGAGKSTVLVFVLDGVDVRMASSGYERLTDGDWVLYPALTPEELVEIAETLEPVE